MRTVTRYLASPLPACHDRRKKLHFRAKHCSAGCGSFPAGCAFHERARNRIMQVRIVAWQIRTLAMPADIVASPISNSAMLTSAIPPLARATTLQARTVSRQVRTLASQACTVTLLLSTPTMQTRTLTPPARSPAVRARTVSPLTGIPAGQPSAARPYYGPLSFSRTLRLVCKPGAQPS